MVAHSHNHADDTDPRVDQLLEPLGGILPAREISFRRRTGALRLELAGEVARRIALLRAFDPLLADPTIAAARHPAAALAGGSSRESATARADYRDLRFHAAGGLGEVFLARNAELNREEALKFLKPGRAGDPESRRRFLQEAEITSRLEHPGVVPIYARGADGSGAPCYAMRFIRGATLQDAIDAFHSAEKSDRDRVERSLALRELLNRFVSVCNTAAYAHSRGIPHRDLAGERDAGQVRRDPGGGLGVGQAVRAWRSRRRCDGGDAGSPAAGSHTATHEVVGTRRT